MSDLFVLLLWNFFASSVLTGLIWTVQLAIYPQFANVPATDFVAYHRRYCWGIGTIVGPLILLEFVAALAWWLTQPSDLGAIIGLALMGLPLFSTALLQAPLHRRLMQGRDDATIRRLVQTNWLRTAAWSARALWIGLALAEQISR